MRVRESVQAFVPHPLPPVKPVLAPECFVEANCAAEVALARLSGVSGLRWPTCNSRRSTCFCMAMAALAAC